MCGLTLEWIQHLGGINAITQRNSNKATLLYETIDNSNGFYRFVFLAKVKFNIYFNWNFEVRQLLSHSEAA
jgi:phosphoserine aminotransferase